MAEGTLSQRRRRNLMNEVLAIATFRMRRELEESVREDPDVQELLDRVVARELDPASAATTFSTASRALGPQSDRVGASGAERDRELYQQPHAEPGRALVVSRAGGRLRRCRRCRGAPTGRSPAKWCRNSAAVLGSRDPPLGAVGQLRHSGP